jgi:tRNA-binding EMAP/Myf-like protein
VGLSVASGDPSQLELVVGRVVAADDHPGARAPSYLLTVDLGGRGTREASIPASGYSREELVDRQVICALGGDEALVLSAHSHAQGVVLLRPDRDVEDGSTVA